MNFQFLFQSLLEKMERKKVWIEKLDWKYFFHSNNFPYFWSSKTERERKGSLNWKGRWEKLPESNAGAHQLTFFHSQFLCFVFAHSFCLNRQEGNKFFLPLFPSWRVSSPLEECLPFQVKLQFSPSGTQLPFFLLKVKVKKGWQFERREEEEGLSGEKKVWTNHTHKHGSAFFNASSMVLPFKKLFTPKTFFLELFRSHSIPDYFYHRSSLFSFHSSTFPLVVLFVLNQRIQSWKDCQNKQSFKRSESREGWKTDLEKG